MRKFAPTRSIAAYLGARLGLSPDEEEIARYGLQCLVYTTAGFLAVVLSGWLLGCLLPALVAASAAAFLRAFSGGAHSSSPVTCTLLGALVAGLLGKAAVLAARFPAGARLFLVAAAFLLSWAVVILRAPVASPARPLSPAHRQKLRLLALAATPLLGAGAGALAAAGRAPELGLAAACGALWQAFSLTAAGHEFASLVDKITPWGREG